jgi:uncharacterized protein (TIGR03032 family)
MTATLHISDGTKSDSDDGSIETGRLHRGLDEAQEIRFEYSENLPSLLCDLKCTLLVSTYKTGNLVCISGNRRKLTPSFHTFDRPMGVAVKENGMAVATRNQIWFLRSAPDIAAKFEPRGQHDAAFLTRYSHFTGDVHCHEIAWAGSELCMVNTLFSCLCTPHSSYDFAPRWRPPFISRLVPEDRCHLNGLAVADGKPRFVSVMAESDSRQGWRAVKSDGGCLIDIASGATVARGLTMPHSPRVSGGKLYVLNSGLGSLETIDPTNGHRTTICKLPGYARGLAIHGSTAFVGLSRIRAASAWDGVPIASNPELLKCGVWVVDLNRGSVTGRFEFVSTVEELFDIQVLPGIMSPLVSGPMAEKDVGQPLWTVMPSN